jgi:hypothetical protein
MSRQYKTQHKSNTTQDLNKVKSREYLLFSLYRCTSLFLLSVQILYWLKYYSVFLSGVVRLTKSFKSNFFCLWKTPLIFFLRIFSLIIRDVCENWTKSQFISISQKLFSWFTEPQRIDSYASGYICGYDLSTTMSHVTMLAVTPTTTPI